MRNLKSVLLFVALVLVATSMFAQESAAAAPAAGGVKWGLVSAAFVLGIAAADRKSVV